MPRLAPPGWGGRFAIVLAVVLALVLPLFVGQWIDERRGEPAPTRRRPALEVGRESSFPEIPAPEVSSRDGGPPS